jgi:iron transport multicopper oxidase
MNKEAVPMSANAVEVEKGDIVDVTIYNDDAMPHAFHLHGHRFWVIKHGHTIPFRAQPDTRWSKSRKRSLHQDTDPTTYPMRDSIEIPPCVIRNSGAGEGGICGGTKGYAVIRFVADNPGIWLLHCHMEWHFGQGLAMTWIEGKDQLQKIGYNGIPQEVRDTCGIHSSK